MKSKIELYRTIDKERDNKIFFRNKEHTYHFVSDPDTKLVGGTTFIKQFMPEFDLEKVSREYAEKHDMSQDEVKAMWKKKGDDAMRKGNVIHDLGEEAGYKEYVRHHGEKEYEQIWNFHKDMEDAGFIIYRSEMIVWGDPFPLGTMIDKVFYHPERDVFVVADYKTNARIDIKSGFDEFCLPPIQTLPACSYTTYSLQISLHRWFLEQYYGKKTENGYILHINQNNPGYDLIEAQDLRKEVVSLLFSLDWESFYNHK